MEHIEIWQQFYFFWMAFLFGCTTGFLYDTVCSIRCGLFLKKHKILGFVFDCFYGAVCGVAGFLIIFHGSDGILRAYPFLGMGAGYLIFEWAAGKRYKYYFTRTLRFFREKLRKRRNRYRRAKAQKRMLKEVEHESPDSGTEKEDSKA